MSLPCLQLLKDAGMDFIVVARPWAHSLVAPFKPRAFVSVRGKFWQDLAAVKQIAPATRHGAIGLILPDSLSSAALFYLARIPSAGYRDDGRSLLLRWPVGKPNQPMHASQKWAYLARSMLTKRVDPGPADVKLDLPAELPSVSFSANEDDQRAAFTLMDQFGLHPHQFVLVAPTATGKHKGQTKTWPYFEQLCQRLVDAGLRVVACPPANERAQAQQAAPQATLVGPLSIGGFCSLAKQAGVVICNDSGAAHLAALVQARQITLFGVTDPADTGPLSNLGSQLGHLGQWPSLEMVLTEVKHKLQHIDHASLLTP